MFGDNGIVINQGLEPTPDPPVEEVEEEQPTEEVDKVNEEPQDTEETPSPKLYAGKYKTIEEMEKGYKELEKKLGSRTTPPDKPLEIDTEAKEQLPAEGHSFEKYTQEFVEKGSLSEDSYKELDSKGFKKDLIDQFIDGQKAKVELQELRTQQNTQEVYNSVGGQEAYEQMVQWAAKSLPKEDIEEFNKVVNGGNLGQIKLAVKGLKASYAEANGEPPKNLLSGSKNTQDSAGYESWAQVTADMADPRYSKDEAFRRKVEHKLANSGPLR